jgi:hypothetical protein
MNRLLRNPWRARRRLDLHEAAPPEVRLALQQANALLEQGQPAAAASSLGDLAQRAEQAGEGRAGWLHLQAARAWNLAADRARSEQHATRGLSLLRPWLSPRRFARLSRRVSTELGLTIALEPMAESSDLQIGEDELPTQVAKALPPKCPQCGATVRPDEAEPLGDGRAACAYCGSILIATSLDG